MKGLNNLSGKAWAKLSKNTWITQKLLAWSHKTPLQKESTFLRNSTKCRDKNRNDRPLDEARIKLIELFTQKGQVVFDPCLRYGDTMMAALFANRQFVGIGETSQQCIEAIERLDDVLKKRKYTLLNLEDQPQSLSRMKNESVDFLLTEIPVFNFKQHKSIYRQHLDELRQNIVSYCDKLKSKAYLALIVADQRYRGTYYCRHADILYMLKGTKLMLQGLINVIQDSQALVAYGYPSTYVPNIINQFVIIFRK